MGIRHEEKEWLQFLATLKETEATNYSGYSHHEGITQKNMDNLKSYGKYLQQNKENIYYPKIASFNTTIKETLVNIQNYLTDENNPSLLDGYNRCGPIADLGMIAVASGNQGNINLYLRVLNTLLTKIERKDLQQRPGISKNYLDNQYAEGTTLGVLLGKHGNKQNITDYLKLIDTVAIKQSRTITTPVKNDLIGQLIQGVKSDNKNCRDVIVKYIMEKLQKDPKFLTQSLSEQLHQNNYTLHIRNAILALPDDGAKLNIINEALDSSSKNPLNRLFTHKAHWYSFSKPSQDDPGTDKGILKDEQLKLQKQTVTGPKPSTTGTGKS